MRTRFAVRVAALVAVGACGVFRPGTPVAVSGPSLSNLSGEWSGSYESRVTGRSGSIVFSLSVAGDTALGDVIMVPRGSGMALAPAPAREIVVSAPERGSAVLSIRFVRAEDDQVRGALDPYEDPDCRCTVMTTFTGQLRDDRIRGTFVTRGRSAGGETTGTWSAVRSSRQGP
jgi:hypothetical protein